MAKKKPVDVAAVERSRSAVHQYAATVGVDESTALPGPATRRPSPLSSALSRDIGYVAPVVGERAPEPTQKSARWEGYNAWDYAKDLVANETVSVSAALALRENGMEYDANYQLPDLKSEDWKQLTDGIDPEKWHVFGDAMSAEMARAISFRLREEQEREVRLMESGILPFLVGNILNPESVLMAIGSGGLSWVQKGNRLRRAMKLAGMAGGENLVQESALFALQDNRDASDMAFAAAAGLALGGAFGALGKGLPDDVRGKMADGFRNDADRIAIHQAEELKLIPPQPRKSLTREVYEKEQALIEHDVSRALDAEEARLSKLEGSIAHNVDETGLHTVTSPNGKSLAQENGEFLQMRRSDVAEGARGRGEGTAMMERMLKEANARGMKGVSSDVSISPAQVRVYERLRKQGYQVKQNPSAINPETGNLLSLNVRNSVFEVTPPLRETRTNVLDTLRTSRKTAKNIDERVESLPEILKGKMKDRLTVARKDLDEGLKLEEAAPETFAPDSAGAASLAHKLGVDVSKFAEPDVETAATRSFGFRFDISRILRSAKLDPSVRARTEAYVGDSIPEKGKVSKIGASEVAQRLRERHLTLFSQVYEPAYKAFVESVNGGRLSRSSRKMRKLFGQAVTKALKGVNTDNVHANKAAARLSQIFGEMGDDLKAANVKGFEDFVRDAKYLPRVPDRQKALRSRTTYGEHQMVDAVRTAIKKGYDDMGLELADDILERMAKGYYKTIHDLSLGIEGTSLNGIRLADKDQIAGLMRLGGVDDEVIADVIGRLRTKLAEPGEGTARHAKQRTLLDEDYEVSVQNKETGGWENKSLRDLMFHDDAEQVFQTYNHVMSGWTGLARQAGIKSRADHTNLMDNVKHELEPKDAEKVVRALDDSYKHMLGQPIYDTKGHPTARRIGRWFRDYNFARVMNMVGFAQLSDSAAFLTPHYLRHLGRHLPDMASMFRRMQDGTIEHKLVRELEEFTSAGTDRLHNKLFSAFDDEPDAPLSKIEHGTRVLARVTERNPIGVAPITVFNQRLTEVAISQRFTDDILGKTKTISADRWKQLGIDEEMSGRIKAQMDKHVEYDGRKLRSMDLAKWDDGVARESYLSAVWRESKRLIQEEDFGDTHRFMHSGIGKLLFQFRRFGLVSTVKQFGHTIANPTVENFSKLFTQVAMGSLSYASQMYLYSMTKPEGEREEWRAKYLTGSRIFLGGIARAGAFALTPAVVNQVYEGVTQTEGPFSHTRTTGLGQGFVNGVPTFDLIARTIDLASDLTSTTIRTDQQFDRRDFNNARKVLPFANMIVVKQLMDGMALLFPEESDDADADVAEYIGGLTGPQAFHSE